MLILNLKKYIYYIILRLLGWRPIATAPTDGTIVIILEEHGMEYWNTFQAQYIDEKPYSGWLGVYQAKYVNRSSECDPHYMPKSLVTTPDFWRPLPKAPRFYQWWKLTENDIEVKKEENEE